MTKIMIYFLSISLHQGNVYSVPVVEMAWYATILQQKDMDGIFIKIAPTD